MAAARREQVVLSDGATLWTELDLADGVTGLVLLHGGPGMWDNLAPVAELVAGRVSTVRYDQRGCGRSSLSTDYRLARYVADLDELRAHAGFDRWYVFGHFFGATLAPAYAYPDRVAGVVYSNGVGLHWSRHKSAYEARSRGRLTAAQASRRDELQGRHRDWNEEVEWRTLSWLPNHGDPETAAALAARAAATPPPLNRECNRALNEELKRLELTEKVRFRNVPAPVLLIHGGQDPRPPHGVLALGRILPDARVVVMPAAGHEPWHEHAPELRDLLLSFLTEPR